MQRALLVIDMQNDFLPGGALAVAGGDTIVPYVAELMLAEKTYELVVLSQDWHPANHGSFASQHENGQPFTLGVLDGREQMLWPDHCVQRSGGARLAEPIYQAMVALSESGRPAVIVKKGQDVQVDSYSAFFDNGRCHDTGLQRTLEAHNITAVDVVGLAFDVCVKATALDAVQLGYPTRILLHGTRAVVPDKQDEVIAELAEAGIECVFES